MFAMEINSNNFLKSPSPYGHSHLFIRGELK